MSLELKKRLVDDRQFDVSQEQMEARLFDIMQQHGFGHVFVSRYRMIAK